MAGEPNWAQVLTALYEEGMGVGVGTDVEMNEIGLLEEKTGLSQGEIEDHLDFLRRTDLVAHWGGEESKPHDIGLTSDGFRVAHERELSTRREKTNTALVIFTLALVLVGIVGNFSDPSSRFLANIIIMIGIFAMVWWTDLLNLPGL